MQQLEQVSDKKVLALLETEPQEAMTQLVTAYTALLWHVAEQYLTDPEDIRECVNDTFSEFYLHRGRFDPDKGTLAAFLAAIARNRAISRYRRDRARRQAALPAEQSDGGEEMERVDARLDLERAMAQLKPEDAEIIRMKYYDGKTVKEIAEDLGLPYETVKKRHQRSLGKLKILLLSALGALILALLAACAYVALRHFGILPGYGAAQDNAGQLYAMFEPTETQGSLTDCWLSKVVYQNGHVAIELLCEAPDEETLDIQKVLWGRITPSIMLCYDSEEYPGYTNYSAYNYVIRGEDSVQMLVKASVEFPLPKGAGDQIDVTIRLWDMDFPVTLLATDQLPAERFPHLIGEWGSLVAIPQLEDGQLSIELYPMETAGYSLSSKVLWSSEMQGRVGDITAIDPDGRVLTGEFDYSTFSSDYFSRWNFGPAKPGPYTLRVPYMHLKMPITEPIVIPLDLEHCTWEEGAAYELPCGKLYVEGCQEVELPEEGQPEFGYQMRRDNVRSWILETRCDLESGLNLVNLHFTYITPEFEDKEHRNEVVQTQGTWEPGIMVSLIDKPEDEDPTRAYYIIQVDMTRPYDLTNIQLTTAEIHPGRSMDISLRAVTGGISIEMVVAPEE